MSEKTIAGRYRIERAVGRGGMGTVWLCVDELLGRTVAVKQVGHLPGESSPDLARALREARSSAALNHLNVVSIFDAVEEDDDIWLVMEYVPGRTLSEVMKEEGRLTPARVTWIGAQVADGLAAAHLRGTMHRDVKPSNILVTESDHAKISDFGIARTMGDQQLTQTGMVTGTPAYFSPGLARGLEPSAADDVWALGASLYAAVEGRPPHPEQSNALAMLATIASAAPAPPEHAGALTEPITRMLDLDPENRMSMADVAHTLHRLHEERELTGTLERTPAAAATPVPEPEPAPTPAPTPEPAPPIVLAPEPGTDTGRPRRRWPILVLAASAVLLAFVVGLLLLDGPDETDEASSPPSTSPSQDPTSSGPQEPTEDPTTESTNPNPEQPTATDPVVAGDPAGFVEGYYAALPEDTETAWALLSPDLQAQVGSYEDYQGFWATIASVTVDDAVSSGQDAVDVTITYTSNDGRVEQEVRRLAVEPTDDTFLIVGDEVVG